jgi:hypothetical protein
MGMMSHPARAQTNKKAKKCQRDMKSRKKRRFLRPRMRYLLLNLPRKDLLQRVPKRYLLKPVLLVNSLQLANSKTPKIQMKRRKSSTQKKLKWTLMNLMRM